MSGMPSPSGLLATVFDDLDQLVEAVAVVAGKLDRLLGRVGRWRRRVLCGLGIGLAFVTATVAALAGIAEHEAGLASGLSNTALQIGTALGVAILATVAVTRSDDYLTAHAGANPLVALDHGYQSAFLALVVLAGIGMALALLFLGRPRQAGREHLEPARATGLGE
jgi:MFS family permease